VNAILHAVIFKMEASGYIAFSKHFAITCIGASLAIAFLKDLHPIFLAFYSEGRKQYLRRDLAFVSYDASIRLDCYDMSCGCQLTDSAA
jgi:hypothetical protein